MATPSAFEPRPTASSRGFSRDGKRGANHARAWVFFMNLRKNEVVFCGEMQWDFPMLSRCWCWMLLLSIWAPSHDQLQVNEAGNEYREPHWAYHQQGVKGRW